MVKQFLALFILTILMVVATTYAQHAVQALLNAHTFIDDLLAQVFSGGKPGLVIKDFLGILAIPVLTGLVVGIIYWIAKRRPFPYFFRLIWILWLIQFGALIMQYQGPMNLISQI